jgi:hypothetical protein
MNEFGKIIPFPGNGNAFESARTQQNLEGGLIRRSEASTFGMEALYPQILPWVDERIAHLSGDAIDYRIQATRDGAYFIGKRPDHRGREMVYAMPLISGAAGVIGYLIPNMVREVDVPSSMSEERKRLRLGIARKLAPAVMFLLAAVEGAPTEPREIPGEDGRMEPNPAYVPGETTSSLFRKTLANEFGLTQEVAPEKLDESIATLERFLSGNITYNTAVREKIRGDEGVEIIEGEELGKRMFAEVLPSDDQYASDLEQNEAIEEAMNRERAALLEEKEKELDGVIDTRDAALGDEIAHGQQVVTTAETTLSQMQAHKGRLEQEREQQRAALQAAEDKPLKKAAFGGLFGGAYTQDEKDADVARARAALADTESKIRTLSEQMESTRPTVNITSLEEKRRKLQSLKRAA